MTERVMRRHTSHPISATPRSGIALLCEAATYTGVAAPALQAKVDLPVADSLQGLHVKLMLALEDALAQ